MDKIAILIPCYNEALSIRTVLRDCKKYLPEATIYVYDNNSTDDTVKIALEENVIVRHEYLQGKGNVIRRMFREVDAECYLMVDGDNTYELSSAREMCDLVLSKHSDMVVGDRLSSTYYQENKRPFHNFGNNLVRFSINHLFKSHIKDMMTGYRTFSYQFVKTFPVLSKGFEIETEMSIHAVDKNMQIDQLKIEYRDRQEGSFSKLNTFKDGFKVIKTIISLFRDYRPMLFFSIIAFILAALSIGFFIPVLITYINTSSVPNFPTLIVCCFTFLAAIINFFTGTILSVLRKKDKQNFEFELIHTQDEFIRKKDVYEK